MKFMPAAARNTVPPKIRSIALPSLAAFALAFAHNANAQTWPVEPPYDPIPPIGWDVTASSSLVGRECGKAINTELTPGGTHGLNANGLHNTTAGLMWLSNSMGANPASNAWFRIDFGGEIRINALKLWNYNEGTTLAQRGVREVDIYTTTAAYPPIQLANLAAAGWTHRLSHEFEPATGMGNDPGCALLVFPNTLTATHLLLRVRSSQHGNTAANPNFTAPFNGTGGDPYVGFAKIQLYNDLPIDGVFVEDLKQTTATLGSFCTLNDPSAIFTVFWAHEDQGDTHAWTAAPGFGFNDTTVTVSGGTCSAPATSLTPGAKYVFRVMAVSGGKAYWSELGKFTAKTDLAEVEMLGYTADSVSDIKVNVRVVWTGPAPDTDIVLFWGPVEGGNDPANWLANNPGCAPTAPISGCTVGNDYSFLFSVHAENMPYWCRAFAVNAAGTNAAPSSLYFIVATFTAADVKTLYWGGGTKDIAHGTPLAHTAAALTGTWNKSLKNWSVDVAGSQYVAWEDGGDKTAVLRIRTNQTAVVTLAEPVFMNKLVADLAGMPATVAFQITADSPVPLTLSGLNPEINLIQGIFGDSSQIQFTRGARLSAPNGLSRTGGGRVYVRTPNDLDLGRFTVEGPVYLENADGNTGTLRGVSEFWIKTGGNILLNLTAGPNDRIHDNAVARLSGSGTLQFDPNFGNNTGVESLRQLILDANGRVAAIRSDRGKIILNDPDMGILRGPFTNGTLQLEGIAGGAGNLDEVLPPNLVVSNGVPAGVLLPWVYTTRANPVMLDAATLAFAPIPMEPAPGNVATWESNKVYRAQTALTGQLPSLPVTSLAFNYPSAAPVLTIADGQTLDVTSGHIGAVHGTLGNIGGTLTGGKLTSGSKKMHAFTPWGSLVIESEITGGMDFIKSGTGSVFLRGASVNSYKGVTHVNSGVLNLNKTVPQAAIPGDLVIHPGATAQFEAWNTPLRLQMFPTNATYLVRGGLLSLNAQGSRQDFYKEVRFENGAFQYSSSLQGFGKRFMGPGFGLVFNNGGSFYHEHSIDAHALQILTDVLCEPGASNQVAFTAVAGNRLSSLALTENPPLYAAPSITDRVYEIHKGAGLLPGVPEMAVLQPVETAFNADVNLVKKGGGDLALERVSGMYYGKATVLDGSLLLNAYAPQKVTSGYGGNVGDTVNNIPSIEGLHIGQACNYRHSTNIIHGAAADDLRYGWIASIPAGGTSLTFPVFVRFGGHVNENPHTFPLVFFASGPLGWADITVAEKGVLGGTGGHGGSVFVTKGGTLRAGTPAKRISDFHIGGNTGFVNNTPYPAHPNFPGQTGHLDFSGAGVWQVDLDATDFSNASIVHVSGDITLTGGSIEPFFHNAVKARPKGVWLIAKYGGKAEGKMTAPQGCKVRVDELTKEVHFVSAEAGTLLLIR